MRRPTCFPRVLPGRCPLYVVYYCCYSSYYYYYYYYYVHRAHGEAHVFGRAGPGRGSWYMVCYSSDTTAYCFGYAWVAIRQNNPLQLQYIKSPRVYKIM